MEKELQEILHIVFTWVQNITVLVVLFLLVTNIQWMLRNKAKINYGIPVFLLVAHALVFYIYTILVRYSVLPHPEFTVFFTYWSAALRLHEFATFAIMERLRLGFTHDREQHVKDLEEPHHGY